MALLAIVSGCSSGAASPEGPGDALDAGSVDAAATVDATAGVGRCDYRNAFSGHDECKAYLGAAWTAASAADDCAKQPGAGGAFVAGGACAASTLGRCVVAKGDGLDATTELGGVAATECSSAELACTTFAGGTFVAGSVCASATTDDHTVFIWPTQSCVDPLPGEPAGQSADGKVCTWNLISACTEEGRDYRDYGSCDVVRTNRPYYPVPARAIAGASDPRRADAAYLAESAWAKRQVASCACVCCHTSAAPKGAAAWSLSDDPLWADTISDEGVAMFAGYVDSSVLGAFDPADNNGFDRVHSALPSTDPTRMVGFFQREFDRRGLTQSFVAGIPPFGAALVDQLSYQPQACQAGEGVDASGKLVWSGGKPARYVYVLEAGSDNPGIPPNFDLPAGTVWRVDVPHDGQPLASGLAYGAVPSGATQRFPASAPPAPLVAGHVYTLYVLYDVALPLARCTFSAP